MYESVRLHLEGQQHMPAATDSLPTIAAAAAAVDWCDQGLRSELCDP